MRDLVTLHCPLRVDEIPSGWELVSVGDIIREIQTGFASGKHNSDGIGIPHLRPMNVDPRGQIDMSDLRFVEGDNPLRLRRGDVLFNNTNSPAWVGKTALIDTDDELAFSNHMTRLRMPSDVVSAFVAKQLHFLCSSGYFLQQCKKHVNQASINRDFLSRSTPFLVPPTAEQRRIVAKIESLQERSSRAREALSEVGPLLEQFRQGILAAAFRGDLTADWREQNPDVEPARELLERIRKERRKKWEKAERAKYEAKGKKPPKGWKDRYKEPEPVEESELPELPEGWLWTPLEQVTSLIADIDHKMPKAVEEGVKFLSAKDLLDDGTLNFTDNVKEISEEDYVRLSRKAKPQRNDIIYSRIGARLGKSRLVETDERFLVSYSCVTIRPLVDPTYLAIFLDCDAVLRRAMKDTQSIGVPDLGLARIYRFEVPLPPLDEQLEIVRLAKNAIETIWSLTDLAAESESSLTHLDQSILAKAFRGELVPQDLNDEPAGVLLERIREERETGASTERRRRPAKKGQKKLFD